MNNDLINAAAMLLSVTTFTQTMRLSKTLRESALRREVRQAIRAKVSAIIGELTGVTTLGFSISAVTNGDWTIDYEAVNAHVQDLIIG